MANEINTFIKALISNQNLKKDSTISGVILSTLSFIYFIYYIKPKTNIPMLDVTINVITWLVAIYLICRGVPKQMKILNERKQQSVNAPKDPEI